MKKTIISIIVGFGVFSASVAYALVTLPPSVQRGDLLVATSTTSLVRLPTSTAGYVLTMVNGIPTWTVASSSTLSGTPSYFPFYSTTSTLSPTSTLYYQTSTGNIGIGITNPATALDVSGQVNSTNGFNVNSYNSSLKANRLTLYGANGGFLSSDSVGNMSLGYGATTTMTMLNSGNIGIGTTTPANLLDVNGNADVQGNLAVGTTTTSTATLNVLSAATTTASFVHSGTATTTVIEGSASSTACHVMYGSGSASSYQVVGGIAYYYSTATCN